MLLIDFELAVSVRRLRPLAGPGARQAFRSAGEFAAATIASSGVSIDVRSQAMLDRLFELTIILGVIGLYVARQPSWMSSSCESRASTAGARWTPHRQLLLA